MKNICDPSEEEALTSKTKSCWLKHEISSYEIYRLIIQGNMIEVVYLHLEGIFTKILSVISDRNPGKLVFQKLKSSGVGPAGSIYCQDGRLPVRGVASGSPPCERPPWHAKPPIRPGGDLRGHRPGTRIQTPPFDFPELCCHTFPQINVPVSSESLGKDTGR